MATREQLFEALELVYDTCSLFNGTRLDIVEMGLVHDVEQDEGNARPAPADRSDVSVPVRDALQIIEVLSALPGANRLRSSRFQGSCGGRSG